MTAENDVLDWLDGQREAMTALLADLVNIDSGSYNKAGVDAVAARLDAHLEAAGIPTERVENEDFGDALRATVAGRSGAANRPILLMGHRDTVFPMARPRSGLSPPATSPTAPVADMKSGLVMNTFVLEVAGRWRAVSLVGLYLG